MGREREKYISYVVDFGEASEKIKDQIFDWLADVDNAQCSRVVSIRYAPKKKFDEVILEELSSVPDMDSVAEVNDLFIQFKGKVYYGRKIITSVLFEYPKS
jgi:hypothetical protein